MFYKKCLNQSRRDGFTWVVSLIGRDADASECFQKIENDWKSIDDITYKEILFVFSIGDMKESTFFNIDDCGTGEMYPFAKIIGSRSIAKYNAKDARNSPQVSDWSKEHSKSVTEFIREFNINESQVPCLYIVNLKNNNRTIVPVSKSVDIYMTFKCFIGSIGRDLNTYRELREELDGYKNVNKYYDLKEGLYRYAEQCVNTKEKETIIAIIEKESSFKQAKGDIERTVIRNRLKKLGQWERQFILKFEQSEEGIKYIKLKADLDKIIKELDKAVNNMDKYIKHKEYMMSNNMIGNDNTFGDGNIFGSNNTININKKEYKLSGDLDNIIELINRGLDKMPGEEAESIKDAVVMVHEEITKVEPKSQRIRNGISLLAATIDICNGIPQLSMNISKFIEYAGQYIK